MTTDAVLEPGKTSEMPEIALPTQLPFANKSETFKKMTAPSAARMLVTHGLLSGVRNDPACALSLRRSCWRCR